MIRTLAMAGLSALALTACAATPTGMDATSRFDNYNVTSKADLTTFDMVYLAPIEPSQDLLARVGYRTRGLSDTTRPLLLRDIEGRIEDLEDDMRGALAQKAKLVDAPAPGVLTIAVVLTDLDANRATQADMADEVGLSSRSAYRGGAGVTITFSENGTVLATAADSNVGQNSLEYTTPAIWGEANRFFDRISAKVAALLG